MEKFLNSLYRHPYLACVIAGCVSALAMAPANWWPLLALTISVLVLIVQRMENPKHGALCLFLFSMGYFTCGLYWVANALKVNASFAWAIPFAMLGLPLLLSVLWVVAGYASVKFSKPNSAARAFLFLTLLCLAEYGRAFNFSGFPWNLLGYTWADHLPMLQITALGGIYLLNGLTIYWAATPALLLTMRGRKNLQIAVCAFTFATIAAAYAYGINRLNHNPTQLRDDVIATIIQPNIKQEEKWDADKALANFNQHIDLSRQALNRIKPTSALKSVALIWPETALDDSLLTHIPQTDKALIRLLRPHAYNLTLVSGLFREEEDQGKAHYYNSLGVVSVRKSQLTLEDAYDKHHLVPFGEYLPFENQLHLTPLVGFAGFAAGPGPRVIHPANLPPFSSMICFEAIFPWYAKAPEADWLVNTSNDGWYGDTPGPYQHLVMTRVRAIEQGIPIIRSATTGISAVIDSYGRIVDSLPYQKDGAVVSYLPEKITDGTTYGHQGEAWFFVYLAFIASLFAISRHKRI